MQEQEPNKPPQKANNPQEQEEKTPFAALLADLKPLARSKKAWAAAVLCLLLFLGTAVVPVGKIPFLRSLAEAMGYSTEEAQSLSFLKALLSWNEHAKRVQGEADGPDASGVFGKDGGFLASQDRLIKEKDSRLFNMRAVNAALAQQGKATDKIAGAHYTVRTGDEDPSAAAARIRGTAANTQANAQTPSEVFFGTDSSSVQRNPQDGFNSVDSLKKIANPHIAGSGNMDWMDRLVDKAVLTDPDLQSISKKLDTGGMLSQLAPITDIGRHKAQRDMYYAWMTGRTANRTPNIVLKKTLAAAGFDGSSMPKRVFDSSGFSGIGITSDAVVGDLDNIKLRIEKEEECNQALETSGEKLTNQLEEAKSGINMLAGAFPKTCDDIDGNFTNRLSVLRNQCEQVKLAYNDLRTSCGVAIKAGREGTCTTNNLQGRYDQYAAYCTEEKQKCAALGTPEEQAACLAAIKKAADYDEGDCYGGGCSEQGISKLVAGTFNIGVGNNPVDPNAGDFFPETDWGNTNW